MLYHNIGTNTKHGQLKACNIEFSNTNHSM